MPPMTPSRITGIGTSSPRPSINGFRTLSLSPATRVQTRKMTAGCVAFVAKTLRCFRCKDIDDDRQCHQHRRHLYNSKQKRYDCPKAGCRKTDGKESDCEEQRLDHRYADNA